MSTPHLSPYPPRFVVFEGVDGVGKTALTAALTKYYQLVFPQMPTVEGSFPGSVPRTLGGWVYKLHHSRIEELSPASIAPPALQVLHVAAHVDAILSWIGPALESGNVILDRYWWSTYAYARSDVDSRLALSLVAPEMPFWRDLPTPIVVYVTRSTSLKGDEVSSEKHLQLDRFYREIISQEQRSGEAVLELENDGEFAETWSRLLTHLGLPYAPL